MQNSIADNTAIAFSKAFYEVSREACSLQEAFDLAKNYIKLQNLPGADLPDLLELNGDTASTMRLI